MSAGVIMIVLAARAVNRRDPGLLIAVSAAISLSWAADLAGRGVAVLGPDPTWAAAPGVARPRLA